jgi:hypothetical protein
MEHDEQNAGEDELLITTDGASTARGPDSLGPTRSLPARPSRPSHGPLATIGAAIAALAAFALFAMPPRATINVRSVLKQTIEQLGQQGIALSNVQCPHELALTRGEPFTCSARTDGVAVRVQLTPVATREHGPIDGLRPHVDGAVGVADVARLAAERFAANASVTCPHRLWLGKPGSHALCTLHIGKNEGPLSVTSQGNDGELELEASWVTAQR